MSPSSPAAIRADYAALVLRVALGVLFIAHGFLLKVMTFGMAGTTGFFASLGYPAGLAWLVMLAETLGGIALLLGIASRWVALALIPVLLGATLVHLPNGWVFSAPGGGWEYPMFWTVALVVQALLGDGAHALGPRLAGRAGRLAPPLRAA
jgi:putative oxidoreductase